MLRLGVALVALWLCAFAAARAGVADELELFDRVWELVDEHFYDKNFNGVDWKALRAEYRPCVAAAGSAGARVQLIREMLSKLKTSHTELLTPAEPRYYHLHDVFFPSGWLGVWEQPWTRLKGSEESEGPPGTYMGIGVFLAEVEGKTFVKAVWPGFPADWAGLRVGDEIVSADGQAFRPVESFAVKLGTLVTLGIRSTAGADSPRHVKVRPMDIWPNSAFLVAEKNSVCIRRRGGASIGYIRIWSYASERYHDLLVEEVTTGRLKDADALIIDLRDGLGGARLEYLNLFNQKVPQARMVGRDGSETVTNRQWRKPVALLINEGTTSGKELFAYGFKKHGMGKIVGTRSAGAVLGGGLFALPGGNLLYLAVADVTVDGERLEGMGVEPDVLVPFELPYCGGQDPQLERAVELLVQEVAAQR